MFSHQSRVYCPDFYCKIRKFRIGDEAVVMKDGQMKLAQVIERPKVFYIKEDLLCLQFENTEKPIFCSTDTIFYYYDTNQAVAAEHLEISRLLKGLNFSPCRLIRKERIENQDVLDKLRMNDDQAPLYSLRFEDEVDYYFVNGLMTKPATKMKEDAMTFDSDQQYVNAMENR